MKLFEAQYETILQGETDVTTVSEFVLADNLKQVAEFYTNFCKEYVHDLKLIREVVTVLRDMRSK